MQLLLELADDFVDSVTSMSALLARQRHSNKLELRDVQHHLHTAWGIHVPGYTHMDEWREAGQAGAGGGRAGEEGEGEEEEDGARVRGKDFSGGVAALQRLKAFRKAAVSDGHKRRLHIISQAKVRRTKTCALASGSVASAADRLTSRCCCVHLVCGISLLPPTVVVKRTPSCIRLLSRESENGAVLMPVAAMSEYRSLPIYLQSFSSYNSNKASQPI